MEGYRENNSILTYPLHQVDTGGPLTGYCIEASASLNKVAHICYVHTNFIYILWETETGTI